MDDTISRQAAINAVNTALFPKINTAKDAEKALRELPSAQPEGIYYVKSSEEDYEKIAEQFRKIPIALTLSEPEIIRCKDCKWHKGQYYCLNFDVFGFDYNDYCSLAERKEQDDG